MSIQDDLWEGLPSPSPTPTGEELRDEGVARADRATDSEWRDAADAMITTLARGGHEFSAEEIRQWVGDPSNPNAWGGRFLAAIKRGIIRRIGYRQAKRPEAHARVIAVYQGVTA